MKKSSLKRRKLAHLPPSQIDRNPENPRLIFRQEEMDSLLVSINEHGIQVPLTVYREADGYRLIDGERRWRCALKLNLQTVPALIQEKPTELENLLLMYNIHALREQWDYYTIASKLTRVIQLFVAEYGFTPNEVQLSEQTGLSRGQIRRCRLLLDLPEQFKEVLLEELGRPKAQQKLSEDFFIEMERSLKAVTKRMPEYTERLDPIRETLIDKFRDGTINAVTDFRQLSKIATAIDGLGIAHRTAKRSLDRVFDADDETSIRDAYEDTVGFEYDEQRASQRVQSLTEFFDEIIESGQQEHLDKTFLKEVRRLYRRLKKLLGE